MEHITIKKSFKKCGMSTALYGTGNEVLFDENKTLDNNK